MSHDISRSQVAVSTSNCPESTNSIIISCKSTNCMVPVRAIRALYAAEAAVNWLINIQYFPCCLRQWILALNWTPPGCWMHCLRSLPLMSCLSHKSVSFMSDFSDLLWVSFLKSESSKTWHYLWFFQIKLAAKNVRNFFAEKFRKSNQIFPEITGKIPPEISRLTTLRVSL